MNIKLGDAIIPFLMALILLGVFVFMDERGILVAVAAMAAIVMTVVIWGRTELTLIVSFPFLICMPFFLGVNRTPKIFLDEIFLLALLGVVALRVLLKKDVLPIPLLDIFWPVVCLAMMGLTLLYMPVGMVPIRTFFETFGLGVPLCLCMLVPQLSNMKTVTRVAKVLCWVILFLSLAGIVEAVVKYNPIMEYTVRAYGNEYVYLSPELTASTGAPYRPYVVFVHPSDGATVVALCLPFIAALAAASKSRYRLFAAGALLAALAFLGVNGTRGVWVAVAVAAFFFIARFRRYVLMSLPVMLCAGLVAAIFMSDSNFWERVTDLRHFHIRLWYWEQALIYFEDYWLLGMGFGNFSGNFELLSQTAMIPSEYFADIETVSTVDNIFLMMLVEQGILGLLGFLLLVAFLGRKLLHVWTSLRKMGENNAALYSKAALAALVIYLVCGVLADVHLFAKATKLLFMLIGLGWGLGLNVRSGEPADSPAPLPARTGSIG